MIDEFSIQPVRIQAKNQTQIWAHSPIKWGLFNDPQKIEQPMVQARLPN